MGPYEGAGGVSQTEVGGGAQQQADGEEQRCASQRRGIVAKIRVAQAKDGLAE